MNRILSPGTEIYFISNIFPKKKITGVIEVDIISFYKYTFNDQFGDSRKNIWWGGFWNRTIERFFILEAFLREYKFDSAIHMELDNIGFDLAETSNLVVRLGEGLFYPSYEGITSAASIFFVNGISSLENFNKFILLNKNYNDMELLYKYRASKDSLVKDLPVDISGNLWKELGIFDLSSIGQYLFGADKRILKGFNKNMFVNNQSLIDSLIGTKSRFFIEEKKIYLLINDFKIKINNIHVHSKIFKKLSKAKYYNYLIKSANNRVAVIIEFNIYHTIKNFIFAQLLNLKHHCLFLNRKSI